MNKSTIFNNSDILRIQATDFNDTWYELAKQISCKLIEVMDINNWSWISPENIVYWETVEERNNFYKKIIIIKNFNWSEYFELINPSYKILSKDYALMHEWCWSIETVDSNPFMVLNWIPSKIEVSWLDKKWNKINFTLDWIKNNIQEQISYIIHEINHLNWKLISDWGLIKELYNWNKKLFNESQKLYPDLLPSFLEFDWSKYIIHWLWKQGVNKSCTSTHKNIVIWFHFDLKYDFDLIRSNIIKNWKIYKIEICSKCF